MNLKDFNCYMRDQAATRSYYKRALEYISHISGGFTFAVSVEDTIYGIFYILKCVYFKLTFFAEFSAAGYAEIMNPLFCEYVSPLSKEQFQNFFHSSP